MQKICAKGVAHRKEVSTTIVVGNLLQSGVVLLVDDTCSRARCVTMAMRRVGVIGERLTLVMKRWVLLKVPRCDTNGVGEVK